MHSLKLFMSNKLKKDYFSVCLKENCGVLLDTYNFSLRAALITTCVYEHGYAHARRGKTIMLDCGIHPAYSGMSSLPNIDSDDVDLETVGGG